MKSSISIRGEVTVLKHRVFRGIELLQKLFLEEIQTGKKILSSDDRRILDTNCVQKYTHHNLIMRRFIDRMAGLFGRCPGYDFDLLTDDRGRMANTTWESGSRTFGPDTIGEGTIGMWPEVIGLGYGQKVPEISDESLEYPFVSPISQYSYRNTYNSKHGGVQGPKSAAFDYDNDHIAKYAVIYGSGELNELQYPIWEVGLFAPKIQMTLQRAQQDQAIYFDGISPTLPNDVCQNAFWSILNFGAVYYDPTLKLVTSPRSDIYYTFNRDSAPQSISGISAPIAADGNNIYIIAFTPRWNSPAAPPSPAGEWGNTQPFSPASMFARCVLPVNFIKNINYTLTIIWQIYFERS